MSEEHTPATTPQLRMQCVICEGEGRVRVSDVDWDVCRRCSGTGLAHTEDAYLHWQSRAVKAEAELADERTKGRIEWERLQMKRDEDFKKLEAEVERLRKLLAEARSCIFEYPATIDVIEKIDTALLNPQPTKHENIPGDGHDEFS